MKHNIGVAFAILFMLGLPAHSQQYHYQYNGSRVVNQNQIGLNHPAPTQITSVTLSPSAQGIQQNSEQSNPGLPRVPWGSHVTTPGDVQYSKNFSAAPQGQGQLIRVAGGGQPTMVQPIMVAPANAAPTANSGLPGTPMGSHIGTAGDAIRSDLHPEVNRYNDAWWHPVVRASSRSSYSAQPQQYRGSGSSGAATYDDGQQGTHKLTY
ncbi:MAG TPA: hypothetical protein V6C81_31410 [Planktothrix sp.]|jgi:hypothetical protein